MTDELQELREKLAIAEEKLSLAWIMIHNLRKGKLIHVLDGEYNFTIDCNENRFWSYPWQKPCGPDEAIAVGYLPIEVAYETVKKLAAERAEAELPERAKKWRNALKDVVKTLECIVDIETHRPVSATALNIARQALES